MTDHTCNCFVFVSWSRRLRCNPVTSYKATVFCIFPFAFILLTAMIRLSFRCRVPVVPCQGYFRVFTNLSERLDCAFILFIMKIDRVNWNRLGSRDYFKEIDRMSQQTNFRKSSGRTSYQKTIVRTVGVWQRSLKCVLFQTQHDRLFMQGSPCY